MNVLLQIIKSADDHVYHFLNGFAGNPILDRIMFQLEENNLLKTGFFLALYWYFWFRPGPRQQSQRSAILAILVGTLIGLVVTRLIAGMVPFRVRPIYDPNLAHPFSIPLPGTWEGWNSFPSDTATYLCGLAFGLTYLSRRLAIPIVLYTAGLICVPRMFLGVHFASDIVVGAAIGIATVWASLRTEWLRSSLASRVLTFMEEKPHVFYTAAFLVTIEMSVVFWDIRGPAHGLVYSTHFGHYREMVRPMLAAIGTVGIGIACLYRLLRRNSHSMPLVRMVRRTPANHAS